MEGEEGRGGGRELNSTTQQRECVCKEKYLWH